VATQSGMSHDRDVYVKATDAAATDAGLHARDCEMNWHGKMMVDIGNVNWGRYS